MTAKKKTAKKPPKKTAKKPRKQKRTEPQQAELPTLERPRHKELDAKILYILQCQEEKKDAVGNLKAAGEALQQALIAHGFEEGGDPYVYVDGDFRFVAYVESKGQQVVVRKEKARKEEKEEKEEEK